MIDQLGGGQTGRGGGVTLGQIFPISFNHKKYKTFEMPFILISAILSLFKRIKKNYKNHLTNIIFLFVPCKVSHLNSNVLILIFFQLSFSVLVIFLAQINSYFVVLHENRVLLDDLFILKNCRRDFVNIYV